MPADADRGDGLGKRTPPMTPTEKVALFRSLFMGRDDVFAIRWENGDKSGYAPACHSDRVPGVCGKPQVKCSACPNQAFRPITDGEIRGHLQGLQVIGLYESIGYVQSTVPFEDVPCISKTFLDDGWEEAAGAGDDL